MFDSKSTATDFKCDFCADEIIGSPKFETETEAPWFVSFKGGFTKFVIILLIASF